MPKNDSPDGDTRDALSDDTFLEHAAGAVHAARVVFVYGEVNTRLARAVSAQLVALAAVSDAPIRVMVHSQGGHVEAADTIHDLVRAVGPEVRMIGTGWVASAGAHIYAAAKKENRYALPNTRFLLHQPLGGAGGRVSDLDIEVEQIVQMRERLHRILSRATGQKYETIARDTERNFWMNAEQAREYALVHRIVEHLADVP